MANDDVKKAAGAAGLLGLITVIVLVLLGKKPTPTGDATLSGKVTDSSSGSPLPGVGVTVDGLSTTTPGNGSYSIANFAPGLYDVTFTKSGYNTLKEVSMNIVSGVNTQNVSMVPVSSNVGSLSGVVTDGQTGSPIQGVLVAGFGTSTTTDANGAYAFTNITPGTYTVQFSKAGYITVTI